MMDLEELIEIIESHRFAVELNVANDWRTFQRTLRGHPVVQRLDTLLSSVENREAVLRRIQSLSQRETDPRYENLWDMALSVYIDVLAGHDPTLGQLAAVPASRAGHCWWTPRVADRVLAQPSLYRSENVGDLAWATERAPARVASGEDDVRESLIRPDVLRPAAISALASGISARSSPRVERVIMRRVGAFQTLTIQATPSYDREAYAA